MVIDPKAKLMGMERKYPNQIPAKYGISASQVPLQSHKPSKFTAPNSFGKRCVLKVRYLLRIESCLRRYTEATVSGRTQYSANVLTQCAIMSHKM